MFSSIQDWRAFNSKSEVLSVNTLYLQIAGGCVEGFILSELDYWYMPSRKDGKETRGGIERDGLKWIVRTRQEWMNRLCLTKSEFDTGVKNLRARGLIATESHFFGAKGDTRKQLYMRPIDEVLLARLNEVTATKSDNQDIQGAKSQNQDIQTKSQNSDIDASKSEISEVKIRSYSSALTSEGVAADAAPRSKQKAPTKRTSRQTKPKIVAPADPAEVEFRAAMRPLVCRAVTGKDNDSVLWDTYGSEIGEFIKKWGLAEKSPAEFEADYINPNGKWWSTWMAGDPSKPGMRGPAVQKRPTIRELKTTINLLDNFKRNTTGKGQPRAPASPTDPAAALREAEERATARRTASPFLTADLPPVWANQGDP